MSNFPDFDKSKWLIFAGKVDQQTASDVILIPADNPDGRWYLDPSNAQVDKDGNGNERILLRIRGHIKQIIPPPACPIPPRP